MKGNRMHYDRKFKENAVKLSYQRDNINDLAKEQTKIMDKHRMGLPPEFLTKEFLGQFKTEEDVSKFLKGINTQFFLADVGGRDLG